MRFRLVKTGRGYGEPKDNMSMPVADETSKVTGEALVPPIIWEGNKDELLATLVYKEVELIRLKSQLTGNTYWDWHTLNGIKVLEDHINTIKRWLEEIKNSNGD